MDSDTEKNGDTRMDEDRRPTAGVPDTAVSLMRQLLSALEKHGKPGESSKGETIFYQPLINSYSRRSASSTLAGVKTTRQPTVEQFWRE